MTLFQIAMMILAGYATLYELFKLAELIGIASHYGVFRTSAGFLMMAWLCVMVQTGFVLTLTGVDLP